MLHHTGKRFSLHPSEDEGNSPIFTSIKSAVDFCQPLKKLRQWDNATSGVLISLFAQPPPRRRLVTGQF